MNDYAKLKKIEELVKTPAGNSAAIVDQIAELFEEPAMVATMYCCNLTYPENEWEFQEVELSQEELEETLASIGTDNDYGWRLLKSEAVAWRIESNLAFIEDLRKDIDSLKEFSRRLGHIPMNIMPGKLRS